MASFRITPSNQRRKFTSAGIAFFFFSSQLFAGLPVRTVHTLPTPSAENLLSTIGINEPYRPDFHHPLSRSMYMLALQIFDSLKSSHSIDKEKLLQQLEDLREDIASIEDPAQKEKLQVHYHGLLLSLKVQRTPSFLKRIKRTTTGALSMVFNLNLDPERGYFILSTKEADRFRFFEIDDPFAKRFTTLHKKDRSNQRSLYLMRLACTAQSSDDAYLLVAEALRNTFGGTW